MGVPVALPVSSVVNVSVSLQPRAAQQRNFGAALVVGSTDGVISVAERIRDYGNITEISADFATTTPEYAAALLHFSQSPQPSILYVGRFAQVATRAVLQGATLTPTQQLLSNFTTISNGALNLVVNGVPTAVSGLNFTGAVTLPGIAFILDTALTQCTVLWNANYERFEVYTVATGVGATLSYATPPAATGTITFSAQPAANSTITLNGTVVTFVGATPGNNQVQIGLSLAQTLQNLVTVLTTNAASDPQIAKFTYGAFGGTTLELTAAVAGSAGASLTIAASSSPASNGTVSGATLSGGAGTDVSTIMGLNVSTDANVPVAGVAAESASACVAALLAQSNDWYALEFALGSPLGVTDREAVAELIEAASPSRIYGTSISTTDVLTPGVSSDVASILQSLNLSRTFSQYSSSTPYSAVSLFARIATVAYEGVNTTITLKFKQEPGIVAESINANQAATMDAKNCNYYANYDNGTAIVQQGVMANGDYIDERVGLDWLQNLIQTTLYNVLYESPTKIPQTDAGNNQLVLACNTCGAAAVRNGLLAPNIWQGPSFGSLNTGDTLEAGYYFYCAPVATQSQADRAARKSMPIMGAATLSGAIHSISVSLTVER